MLLTDGMFDVLLSHAGRRDRDIACGASTGQAGIAGRDREYALARLSVFEGGFTARIRECIVNMHPTAGNPSMVDVVQRLVDKSFVRPLGKSVLTRWRAFVNMPPSTFDTRKIRT